MVPEQEKLYEIFTASIPDLDSDDNRSPFSIPATRAHLVDGQKMLWDEVDSLGIFSDKQGIGAYGYSDGAFHGEPIEGNKFHAFYPYRKDALPDSENPNLLHARLPYNDRYKEGTFSRHLPMVAVSENNELHFKHTCGILRFSIKSSLYVKLVNLLANDRSEMLIGNGVIDLSEENPVFMMVPDNEPMRYQIDYWVQDYLKPDEPSDLYFIVPVGVYKKGITLRMTGYDMETGEELIFDIMSLGATRKAPPAGGAFLE